VKTTIAARFMVPTPFCPLPRVAARPHAGRIGLAVVLVMLLVLVQAIERAAAGAHETTNGCAFATGCAVGESMNRA
jgi:hypothetical protein